MPRLDVHDAVHALRDEVNVFDAEGEVTIIATITLSPVWKDANGVPFGEPRFRVTLDPPDQIVTVSLLRSLFEGASKYADTPRGTMPFYTMVGNLEPDGHGTSLSALATEAVPPC